VRRTLRVRLNDIEKNVGREGLLTLRSRMAYVQRTTDGMWPTTVYTADGKTFDAEVADPISRNPMRPEITSVLDVATRKCVGFAVSRKENVIAVTEALRLSCSSHGIPAIFYTDRGAGYRNKTFDGKRTTDADPAGLMARLGITKMHALPYNSQAKGLVERFNAQWNRLARQLPSYIGVDMDKEAGGRVHKITRKDIKEFGSSRLLPTWAEFLTLCEALIAEYNDTPHQGLPRIEDAATGRLRHLSPNEAWAQHVAAGFQPILIDPADEDDLWRPYETRIARRALVEWNTNQYFHMDLERYHGERVMVGYDLRQAERVWVREFDRATGEPGKLICVATFSGNKVGYIPKTMEQAALEKRMQGQHKRVDAKTRAIDAQITAPYQIEHNPGLPIDIGLPAEAPAAVALVVDNGEASPQPVPKRRMFGSDLELAQWALEHPTELNPNQIKVLRDCANNQASREYFRMSGISEEQLRALLRSVA
jgi:putative transposase